MTFNAADAPRGHNVLVEAEEFDDFGGWTLDSQFQLVMGSPYLMAHGLGRPVRDARTTVSVPADGLFEVWVRSKDWVPSGHPGRFCLAINGTELPHELGATGQDWSWERAGAVELRAGSFTMELRDLTGFDGRCDAIFLSSDGTVPPEGSDAAAHTWRKQLRGLPDRPVPAGTYDLVVVGGGIGGCVAALTAARLGSTVALIHDRPVLGGNASVEIGLRPRGKNGPLVKELSAREASGDLVARAVLEAEPNITLFLEATAFDVATQDARIVSVDVREARSGREHRISGASFVDSSGIAALGVLAGAETMHGREARSDTGERRAPTTADDMHHGNTVFFRTRLGENPVTFPDVPWANEVAKDYANLSGQLERPGVENGPGPAVGGNPDTPEFDWSRPQGDEPGDPEDNPLMQFPATHFWEYGQWLDPYLDGEQIRDHLMQALYGTFANVKRLEPETYANLELEWIAHVAAQGEFRRYRGDYVLTETDITSHRQFPDTVVENNGAFCLHFPFEPGEGDYDFRLKNWIFDIRDKAPYDIPFRCLYSRNIENLMMAGKHISVTHVAGSSVKLMGNGGQHGMAVGAAAHLISQRALTPREIGESHLNELRTLIGQVEHASEEAGAR
ncbi:FAD-dependent oxidoreductase [Nocardioides sp.]|uniref:FAD-dependent oxidoreductase n=1 Tax=Nocardioides sp. TaxID=35761 RepID=UPI0035ADC0B2